MTRALSRTLSALAFCTLIAPGGFRLVAGDVERSTADLSAYFGFKPVEIIKLEERSANLLAGDFNHDKLGDLVLFDNSHARIDLLLQRKNFKDVPAEPMSGVNDVRNDLRLDAKRLPVAKQLASLTVGDFNGDSRTDIACFGLPDRMMVYYQPEPDQPMPGQTPFGKWRPPTAIRVPEILPLQWNIAAGDLNGDGKDDLVLLGKQQTLIFPQREKEISTSPTTLMNTSEKLALVQVADVDGDRRQDLCYVAGEGQDRVFCARLQDESGRLGPELQFEVDRPRSVTYADVDDKPGREILTIDAQTGRLRVLQMQPSKSDDAAGRLAQFGFGRQDSSSANRDFALGDIDGDGLADMIVTDAEGAGVLLFRQRKGQGLDAGTSFPSFSGTSQVRILAEGDKREVVLLSGKEKAIGVSRFENGRLTFPDSIPLTGDDPVLLAIADVDGDKRAEIVFVTRSRSTGSVKHALQALERQDKVWKPVRFAPKNLTQVPLDLPGTPSHVERFDVDRDGVDELVIFQGSDRPPVFLSSKTLAPVSAEALGGLKIGNVGPGAVYFSSKPEPAVLVAQENFARKLTPGGSAGWRVAEQYNATEPSAKIVGAVSLDVDGQPGAEVVLIDAGIRKLRMYRREGELYKPWREVELGTFPYEAARIADLNSDGRQDLLLMGRGRFAVLYVGRSVPVLNELTTFETKLKKTTFADVIAGDLNGDGRTDLALIDTQSHNLEIVSLDAENRAQHAINFKIFEEKSFSEGQGGTEPREGVIADVTGDGRKDLILLSHDRVLIYPQDAK